MQTVRLGRQKRKPSPPRTCTYIILELFVLGFTVLDIILGLSLLFYLLAGLRNGLAVTLGGIVGFVAGAVAAFFAIPLVSGWVPDEGWRLAAVIATAVVLVLVGHAAGAALGGAVRRWFNFAPLRALDRILGGALNVVVAALVMSMLAFSIGTLGMPFLSQQIACFEGPDDHRFNYPQRGEDRWRPRCVPSPWMRDCRGFSTALPPKQWSFPLRASARRH